MAFTDEQKLDVCKDKFIGYIESIATWDDFKTFVNNISKTQIVNGIKAAVQAEIASGQNVVTNITDKEADLTAFDTELDTV